MPTVAEHLATMDLNFDQVEKPTLLKQWLAKHGDVMGAYLNGKMNVSDGSAVRRPVSLNSGVEYSVELANEATLKESLDLAEKAQTAWVSVDREAKSRKIYALARTFQKHLSLYATAEAVVHPWRRLEKCKGIWASHTTEYLYLGVAHCNRPSTQRPRAKALLITQSAEHCPTNIISEWKVIEALCNDTPIVLAVTPEVCLTALIFAELCSIAGLPPNLLNVLVMEDEVLKSLAVGDDCLQLKLHGRGPHVSTCVVLDGADYHSSISGAIEMFADCVGPDEYRGLSLFVQESVKDKVLSLLRNQVENLKLAESNMNKTLDLVSKKGIKVVEMPHITQKLMEGGPKIYVQTFRTVKEVAGLVSTGTLRSDGISIWTERVGVAIEIADRITGYRHVWINCQHRYTSGISSFGDLFYPSGERGTYEGKIFHSNPAVPDSSVEHRDNNIDRTLKLYYGGAQKRAESNTSYPVFNKFPPFDRGDKVLAYVPCAGQKDVRNAVESALKAFPGWRAKPAFNRSQILYFFGENLSQRRLELIEKLSMNTGLSDCEQELQESIDTVFKWAGHCDTEAPSFTSTAGFKVYSSHEPLGVIAIVCPPVKSMRSLLTMLASAISIGNTVVLIVPEEYPIAPLMLAQVIETSDIPAGVINILSGHTKELLTTLAKHHDVSALWCWSHQKSDQLIEDCLMSRKEKVWWFNVSTKNNSMWPDDELDAHRGSRKIVWIPCRSIFAN